MIESVTANVANANAVRLCCGNERCPPASRRTFIHLVGQLAIVALPAWVIRERPASKIVVVDGWILAATDLL